MTALLLGDCLERMAEIPDGSVDMVMCDSPYGTTQNKWDSVIPLEPLWREYRRACKPSAAIVLTASQPFTSALGASNLKHFRYAWVWEKTAATGHLNAQRMPMKLHEDVLVFSENPHTYNPQDLKPYGKMVRRGTTETILAKAEQKTCRRGLITPAQSFVSLPAGVFTPPRSLLP